MKRANGDALLYGLPFALLALIMVAKPSGQVLSYAQLVALARAANFPDPELAAQVALAESGGKTNAYGDASLGGSVGLWQVNLRAHPQYSRSSLENPSANAQAAYAISRGGTYWLPWSTFVKAWQRLVGVTQDGSFGPQSQAATMQWQAVRGLPQTGTPDLASVARARAEGWSV